MLTLNLKHCVIQCDPYTTVDMMQLCSVHRPISRYKLIFTTI